MQDFLNIKGLRRLRLHYEEKQLEIMERLQKIDMKIAEQERGKAVHVIATVRKELRAFVTPVEITYVGGATSHSPRAIKPRMRVASMEAVDMAVTKVSEMYDIEYMHILARFKDELPVALSEEEYAGVRETLALHCEELRHAYEDAHAPIALDDESSTA